MTLTNLQRLILSSAITGIPQIQGTEGAPSEVKQQAETTAAGCAQFIGSFRAQE
jgi:hypothetical protein